MWQLRGTARTPNRRVVRAPTSRAPRGLDRSVDADRRESVAAAAVHIWAPGQESARPRERSRAVLRLGGSERRRDGCVGSVVQHGWESLGERTRLGPASETTWNLNAALHSDGRVWVVYDAIAGTKAEELFVVEVDWPDASRPAKVTRVRLTEDDGFASKYPDIDMEVETVALR